MLDSDINTAQPHQWDKYLYFPRATFVDHTWPGSSVLCRLRSCAKGQRSRKRHVVILLGWGKPNYVGQSWAAGGIFPTWTSAVKTWYSEVEYFTYGSSVSKGNQAIGHYTQVGLIEAHSLAYSIVFRQSNAAGANGAKLSIKPKLCVYRRYHNLVLCPII